MNKVTKEQFRNAREKWRANEYTASEWIVPQKVLWTAYFDGEEYKILNRASAYSIEFMDTPTEHTENVYYIRSDLTV